jgi:hypothetical protein
MMLANAKDHCARRREVTRLDARAARYAARGGHSKPLEARISMTCSGSVAWMVRQEQCGNERDRREAESPTEGVAEGGEQQRSHEIVHLINDPQLSRHAVASLLRVAVVAKP